MMQNFILNLSYCKEYDVTSLIFKIYIRVKSKRDFFFTSIDSILAPLLSSRPNKSDSDIVNSYMDYARNDINNH